MTEEVNPRVSADPPDVSVRVDLTNASRYSATSAHSGSFVTSRGPGPARGVVSCSSSSATDPRRRRRASAPAQIAAPGGGVQRRLVRLRVGARVHARAMREQPLDDCAGGNRRRPSSRHRSFATADPFAARRRERLEVAEPRVLLRRRRGRAARDHVAHERRAARAEAAQRLDRRRAPAVLRSTVLAPRAISRSMARVVRANARSEPPFGTTRGQAPRAPAPRVRHPPSSTPRPTRSARRAAAARPASRCDCGASSA